VSACAASNDCCTGTAYAVSGDVEADPPESEGNRGGRSGHPVAVSPDGNDQGGAGAALSRVVRPRGEGPSEEAHGLTIEQGETLQKMVLRTVFTQGWFGE
jgi:hypothetical protein